MRVDDAQLRVEQRITEAVRAVERDLAEPVELWARVEHRLDRSGPRRKWFRLTLAAAAAVAVVVAVAVWRVGDRQMVSTDSDDRPIATIEAVCRSLLSMRQDVIPLPDGSIALGFTIERMHAAYSAAADAFDSVAPSDLSPSMRPALDAWHSIFELDALHRLQQAAADIDDGSWTAREKAGGALTMMVVALEQLHDAGIAACDPHR